MNILFKEVDSAKLGPLMEDIKAYNKGSNVRPIKYESANDDNINEVAKSMI